MLWGGFLLLCLLRGALGAGHPAGREGRKVRDVPEGPRISQDLAGGSLAIDTLGNGTRVVEDNHTYYVSRLFGRAEAQRRGLWLELAALNGSRARVHGILSNTHRQASRVVLSFDFPFYGHPLRQLTIATGGFIFTGDVIHRMLTATQYIAPLMANFNPSHSPDSTVRYLDNGTALVVQWDRVFLQGREDLGSFTFQAALHSSGTIVFGYKEIPLPVPQISASQHPVKAGLSDAFMVLNPGPEVPESRRRTIYEYHRVELDPGSISSGAAVEFSPLPTCLQHQSCESCVSSGLSFNCTWCHVLHRCSSGFDRYREEWLSSGCGQVDARSCQDLAEGSASPPGGALTSATAPPPPGSAADHTKPSQVTAGEGPGSRLASRGAPMATGTVVGIVVAVLLLAGIVLAGIYIGGRRAAASALLCIQPRPLPWPAMKLRSRGSYAHVEAAGQDKEGFVEAEQC